MKIVMKRGNSHALTLTLTDGTGSAYDLTDASIWFTVDDLFQKTVGAGITVAAPATGVAAIAIDPADTIDCPDVRTTYAFDTRVELADGTIKTPILGTLVVIPDVTSPTL